MTYGKHVCNDLTNGQREYVLRPPCVHVKYPTSEKRDYNVS